MSFCSKKVLTNVSNYVEKNKPSQVKAAIKRVLETDVDNPNKKHAKQSRKFVDENDVESGIANKIRKITISDPKPMAVAKKSKQQAAPAVVNKDYWKNYYVPPANLPSNVVDYDKTQLNHMDSEPTYSHEIFVYFRAKELSFRLDKYMHKQTELSDKMRAVLVDWLVELQQIFSINHESLYTAVKIVDSYLCMKQLPRARFQLLGLTAFFLACKFDVSKLSSFWISLSYVYFCVQDRVCPIIDDFVYVCDDAYSREDIIEMEIDILKTLEFNINYPLSYSFLRRYARCGSVTIENLTLARYVLETSLLDHSFIDELDSKMAAASLFLALKLKNVPWVICWV